MADEFDSRDPKGKNSLKSKELFKQREIYRDHAYPDDLPDIPRSIDVWYNYKSLYGKIDHEDNAVFLNEEMLKKLPNDEEDIFALNFVVDAFEDLQNYMNVAANKGKILTENSKFFPVKPKRGWTSVQNLYFEHVDVLYQAFTGAWLDIKENYKKLITFKDFMDIFWTYIKEIQPNFPFTRTGFIMSHFCPITTTGLVVEIADDDHGNDKIKFENYINDDNFFFFTAAARRFGFRVDKNAPWRLIADVKSKTMQKYMSRYPEAPPEPVVSGSFPEYPDVCEVFQKYCGAPVSVNGAPGGQITDVISGSGVNESSHFANSFFKISEEETGDANLGVSPATGAPMAEGHITMPEWETPGYPQPKAMDWSVRNLGGPAVMESGGGPGKVGTPPTKRNGEDLYTNGWIDEMPRNSSVTGFPEYEFPYNIKTAAIVVVKDNLGEPFRSGQRDGFYCDGFLTDTVPPRTTTLEEREELLSKSGNYVWITPYRDSYSQFGGKLTLDASNSANATAYLWELLNLEGERDLPYTDGVWWTRGGMGKWESEDLNLSHHGWSPESKVEISGLTERGDYILRLRVRNKDGVVSSPEYLKIRIWDLGLPSDPNFILRELPKLPNWRRPGMMTRFGWRDNPSGWTDAWNGQNTILEDHGDSRPRREKGDSPTGYLNLLRSEMLWDASADAYQWYAANGWDIMGYPGKFSQTELQRWSEYPLPGIGSTTGGFIPDFANDQGYMPLTEMPDTSRYVGIYGAERAFTHWPVLPSTESFFNEHVPGITVPGDTILPEHLCKMRLYPGLGNHALRTLDLIARFALTNKITTDPRWPNKTLSTARLPLAGRAANVMITDNLIATARVRAISMYRIGQDPWQTIQPLRHRIPAVLYPKPKNATNAPYWDPYQLYHVLDWLKDLALNSSNIARKFQTGRGWRGRVSKYRFANAVLSTSGKYFQAGDKIGMCINPAGNGPPNGIACMKWINGRFGARNVRDRRSYVDNWMIIDDPHDGSRHRGFPHSRPLRNFDHVWHSSSAINPADPPQPFVFNSTTPSSPRFAGSTTTKIISGSASGFPIKLLMGDDKAFQSDRIKFDIAVQKVPVERAGWNQRKFTYNEYLAELNDWTNNRIPVEFENLFSKEYLKSFEFDIQTLKVYLLDFYNSYVINNPVVTKTKLNKCGDGTMSYVIKREMITQDDMESQYSDAYWIKFYASLRMLESGMALDKVAMDNFFKRVNNLFAYQGQSFALQKILRIITENTKGIFKEKLLLTPPAKDDKIKTVSNNQPTTIQDVLNHIKNNKELI